MARFIVAPDGFGKSSLAREYAHVVWNFDHVFWISGRSPCFLRDIDAGCMFEEIVRVDRSACLVVFEDLPLLDNERVDSFSRLVDELLARGNEVLVTCAPSCDAYSDLHKDRMVLEGRDLMLDAQEARASFLDQAHASGSVSTFLASELIACLRWDGEGQSQLMEGIRREELSGEELLAMFSLLLLQSGQLADAWAFSGERRTRGLIEGLAARYPYLGIDEGEGVYEAARIDVEALALAFASQFDRLCRCSSYDDRDNLVLRCADALVTRGFAERAVEFVLAFSTKRNCGRWLALRGWDLLDSVSPKAVIDAFVAVDRSVTRRRATLHVIVASAFNMLGNPAEAEAFALRACNTSSNENVARAIACIMLIRLGGESEAATRARHALEKLLRAEELGLLAGLGADSEEDAVATMMWPVAARLALAFDRSVKEGADELRGLLEQARHGSLAGEDPPVTQRFLAAACSWVLDALADDTARVGLMGNAQWTREEQLPHSFIDGDAFARILEFSCEHVDHVAVSRGKVDWYALRLAMALERAYEGDPLTVTRMPSSRALSVMRKAQLALYVQREACRRAGLTLVGGVLVPGEAYDLGLSRGSPSEMKAASGHFMTPVLRVNLFGAFEVRLGEEVVDPALFTRQKMRTLLAILVLNRGKEFTREALAHMLWPASTDLSARKSFYALWSKLRQILSIGGECPYLLRDQYGCRLNPHLVTSDVQVFEELCRMLMFGRTDERGWEYVYARVSVDFAEVLLPGENGNDLILTLREHYRTQLVDALIAASSRLVADGEIRGALWFAREALKRDRTREDAYAAQMEAQIAAEQRAAALETFFQCRRFLAKELGIDPSLRIVSLYRAIIESEEDLT